MKRNSETCFSIERKKYKYNTFFPLEKLPHDIILYILTFFAFTRLAVLGRVSKSMYRDTRNLYVWKCRLMRTCPLLIFESRRLWDMLACHKYDINPNRPYIKQIVTNITERRFVCRYAEIIPTQSFATITQVKQKQGSKRVVYRFQVFDDKDLIYKSTTATSVIFMLRRASINSKPLNIQGTIDLVEEKHRICLSDISRFIVEEKLFIQ